MKATTSKSVDIPYHAHPKSDASITFNDGDVRDAKRIIIKMTDNNVTLSFNDAERPDTGNYTIALSNEFGKCSGTVKLTVLGMWQSINTNHVI